MPSKVEPPSPTNHAAAHFLGLARVLGAVTLAVGASVLLGWTFHLRSLTTVFPGLVTMKAATALCFCGGGLSLLFSTSRQPTARHRWLATLFAGAVVLLGAWSLAEYFAGFGSGFDEWPFKDPDVSAAPGRMAPISACNFVLLGLALSCLQSPRRLSLAQAFAIGAAFTSVLSLVGFIYGVASLYQAGRFTAVALHTSLSFLLLGAGILCATSQAGFMRVATNAETSGLLVRRYAPAGFVLPFLIGWVRVQAVRLGWCGPELGVVIVALSNATAFVAVVWIGAWSLRAVERRQQRAQQERRETEERLNLVVTHLTEGLIIWDQEGNLLDWNPAALSMYGFASQEEGRRLLPDFSRIFEMFTLDGQPLPPQEWPLRRLLAGQPSSNLELRVRRRDQGWERVFRYDGSVVQNSVGKQLAFLTIADITAKKEAQAQLQALADSMPQMVWAARPDGCVDYYNQRWYDYTGLKPGTTGDESWESTLHPDDVAPTHSRWDRSLRTGEPYEIEYRHRRESDGAYRWHLGLALAIRDSSGNVTRWFGTATDIHESKLLREQNAQLLESERTARAEAERIGHMKDEFLATLSHELRTPLNAMLGWTQVLRGDPANSEDVEAGLATIERNARAQKGIIDDLLDMSSIISGKVRLTVAPIDLVVVVEAAIETVRPAADAKGIRLQPVIDPQARAISGDPNRLQQVFWNLLTNAIKFTPKGGRIQVVLERIHSHLEVSIIDSGEGISPEFLPNVFDRFRQQDASTTRRHGGLGLGLAIVKQLVELHGGSIHVDSPGLGQGTTFRVMLPLVAVQPTGDTPGEEPHQIPADSEPPISVDALRLTGVRVLVVDDEPDARALVKRLLEDRGAVVRVAASVAEALELLLAEPPDMLVSDIGMPGEDGYALITRVRALSAEAGGTVPAIALTAYARAEDRMKIILAGFQMHVSKPVEPAELLTMVASLAGRMTSV